MTPDLEVSNVSLWRGGRRLCQGLGFSVRPGEALQLLGVNGAGKTSLLRVLAGLGRLDEGEVRWKGTPIRSNPEHRAELLYLGHANGLKAHLSPKENYRFYQSLSDAPTQVSANQALTHLGIGSVSERPVGHLSMGQRRRAALARLMSVRAKLWLLDEPLTSLDRGGVALVGELLQAHLAEGGLAVLSTHQPLPTGKLPLQSLELKVGP
jgi:heme exporter protein A